MQARNSLAAAVATAFASVVFVVAMPPEPAGVVAATPELTALATASIDPGDSDLDIRTNFASLRTQFLP